MLNWSQVLRLSSCDGLAWRFEREGIWHTLGTNSRDLESGYPMHICLCLWDGKDHTPLVQLLLGKFSVPSFLGRASALFLPTRQSVQSYRFTEWNRVWLSDNLPPRWKSAAIPIKSKGLKAVGKRKHLWFLKYFFLRRKHPRAIHDGSKNNKMPENQNFGVICDSPQHRAILVSFKHLFQVYFFPFPYCSPYCSSHNVVFLIIWLLTFD